MREWMEQEEDSGSYRNYLSTLQPQRGGIFVEIKGSLFSLNPEGVKQQRNYKNRMNLKELTEIVRDL
jgi:hypothetical protein